MNKLRKLLGREQISNEKKQYIKINNYCNNNCIFCLDSANQEKAQRIKKTFIFKQIKDGRAGGANKLILSGGEATIDPYFLEYVKFAKTNGYHKIQVISNGRMFAYGKFAKQAIANGLNEITISIHGHNQKLYEKLTNIPGSFKQLLAALNNLKQFPGLIINIDIVINKLNYKYIYEIIKFYSKNCGIFEYDLLNLTPAGRALINKKILFINLKLALKYLKPVFNLTKRDSRFFIWTNRLPPKYLEGYEYLIQDPHKLMDEVSGRYQSLNSFLTLGTKMSCQDDLNCSWCYLDDFCKKLRDTKQLNNFEFFPIKSINDVRNVSERKYFVEVDRKNYKDILENIEEYKKYNVYFKLRNFSTVKELDQKALPLSLFKEYFAMDKDIKFLDFPLCLVNKQAKVAQFLNLSRNAADLDLKQFTMNYIRDLYYIKALKCDHCRFNKKCSGWHINYVRYYGFKIFNPVI